MLVLHPDAKELDDTASAPARYGATAPQSLLRFLTCGSVDDGKSTLIGRLLYECGSVPDDQLAVLESDSRKFGTDGSNPDFALLVDGLSAEREQGITIDVAYRYFSTRKRAFIVADTPGHEQYTRNMATGASTADLAVLLVDARKGLLMQTRRHAFIAAMLGIPHVILAVNKMDLAGYDRTVFEKIEQEFRSAVADLRFASIDAIPLSARSGANVVTRSDTMDWYGGPPLLDLLETIDTSAGKAHAGDKNSASSDVAFLMPVQWVNRPDGNFRGFSGLVASGAISTGDPVTIRPGGQAARIARIVAASGEAAAASAGEAVTLVLDREIDVSRGDVIAASGAAGVSAPARVKANLFWTGSMPGREDEEYIVQIASAQTRCRLTDIHYGLDIETYQCVPAEKIAMNGVALVALELSQPLPLTDYSRNRLLGSLILIDRYSNETVAIGMIDQQASTSLGEAATGAAGRSGWYAASARHRFQRWAGAPGTVQRGNWLQRVSWRLVSAGLVAVAAGGASGSLKVAIFGGLADICLRPLMHRWHRAIWRKGDANDLNLDGGGI